MIVTELLESRDRVGSFFFGLVKGLPNSAELVWLKIVFINEFAILILANL